MSVGFGVFTLVFAAVSPGLLRLDHERFITRVRPQGQRFPDFLLTDEESLHP